MATRAKQHPIEKELAELLDIKRGSKDSDTAFAKKLHEAATECDPTVWEQISEEGQAWVNAYTDAVDAKAELPGYDLEEHEEPAEEEPAEGDESEPEEAAEEAPKGRGRAAKPAKAKAGKEAAQKPRKGAEKPAAKAPAKAAKEAAPKGKAPAKAKNGNGHVGFTPAWRKALIDVGKKGEKGVTTEQMKAICEKHEVRLYYRRFEVAGYLEKIGRGVVKLTKAGQDAVERV